MSASYKNDNEKYHHIENFNVCLDEREVRICNNKKKKTEVEGIASM